MKEQGKSLRDTVQIWMPESGLLAKAWSVWTVTPPKVKNTEALNSMKEGRNVIHLWNSVPQVAREKLILLRGTAGSWHEKRASTIAGDHYCKSRVGRKRPSRILPLETRRGLCAALECARCSTIWDHDMLSDLCAFAHLKTYHVEKARTSSRGTLESRGRCGRQTFGRRRVIFITGTWEHVGRWWL